MKLDVFSGYYTYKSLATVNKYEILLAADNIEDVKYHFHDDFFSSFNWYQEPPQSIEYLYAERARQLRANYDYIILLYSGGADSHNILQTFVDNNIFLDEICSFINYKANPVIEGDSVNHEILTKGGAKDIVEKIKHPKTKYRLYDYTESSFKLWKDESESAFWCLNQKPRGGKLQDCDVEDWKKLLDSSKKICLIFGNNKPVVKIVGHPLCNPKLYFEFSDALNSNFPFRENLISENVVDEQFYWSPTIQSANMIIKQCHLIKHYFTDKNLFKLYLKYKNSSLSMIKRLELYSGTLPDSPMPIRFGGDEMKSVIYPKWGKTISPVNPVNKIQFDDPISNFLYLQEKWFWDSNTYEAQKYLSMIEDYNNQIKPAWKTGEIIYKNKLISQGLKILKSKPYFFH